MTKLVARIKYFDVRFLWIREHNNYHVTGLCKFATETCIFKTIKGDDGDIDSVLIYQLSVIEKCKWLLNKKIFEICVGKYWTYANGKLLSTAPSKLPVWLETFMFNLYCKLYN